MGGSLLVFIAVFFLTRYVSLGSVLSALSIPLFAAIFLTSRSPVVLLAFLGIPLLVVVKHHANIRRLLSGTESRFGAGRKVPA